MSNYSPHLQNYLCTTGSSEYEFTLIGEDKECLDFSFVMPRDHVWIELSFHISCSMSVIVITSWDLYTQLFSTKINFRSVLDKFVSSIIRNLSCFLHEHNVIFFQICLLEKSQLLIMFSCFIKKKILFILCKILHTSSFSCFYLT